MCNDVVAIPLPNSNGEWIDVSIDECIAPIVTALNKSGIRTIESCCGHGTSGSIDLEDGRRLVVIPARFFEE